MDKDEEVSANVPFQHGTTETTVIGSNTAEARATGMRYNQQ